MKDFFLQRLLRRLEKDGNDDPTLIVEFGADSYTTQELGRILTHVTLRKKQVDRRRHRLFLIGFSISFWIAAAFVAGALSAHAWGFFFLAMVPVSLASALLGHFYLRRRFPSYHNSHVVTSIIQQELDRRKKDASIF